MDQKRIRDLIHLSKIQKEVKEKNIQQEWQKAGYETSLKTFHKPVIEKIEESEIQRKDHFNTLSEEIRELYPISTPLALQDIEKKRVDFYVETDHDLDEQYLTENKFPMPSEILVKIKPEEIKEYTETLKEKIIDKLKELGNLKSQVTRGSKKYNKEELNHKITMLRLYKRKIEVLKQNKELYNITGSGISLVNKLENLTEKLKKGNKSKKLHNEIVAILDALLENNEITKDEVVDYYETFFYSK